MEKKLTGQASIHLDASLEAVWEALTDPAIIKKYFFNTNTQTDWKPGSPIRFYGEWDGKSYEDKGTVLDVEKNKMLRYKYWSSMSGTEDKPENYATITYELSGADNDVTLTISQDNIADGKMKQHAIENWNKVLKGLKDVVEAHAHSEA